ncbi:hypothetical protein KPL74_21665 [Bacillus sp. NP157]|nr:hypothetical protein KPL74_21665 [Bacillus sp. NP157]
MCSPRRVPSWRYPPVAMLVLSCLASACASSPAHVDVVPGKVAKQWGFPGCEISVPLSPAQVVDDVKTLGGSAPETYPEWNRLLSVRRDGDQLRLVDCTRERRNRDVGDPYYYALFRDDKVIAELHFAFFD